MTANAHPPAAVEVHLPATLPPLFAGLPRELSLQADSVGGALAELERRWPGLLDRLCLPGPELRPHIKVFVDREKATLATPLSAGARLDVITAISGG